MNFKTLIEYFKDELNFCYLKQEEATNSSDYAYWKGKAETWESVIRNLTFVFYNKGSK